MATTSNERKKFRDVVGIFRKFQAESRGLSDDREKLQDQKRNYQRLLREQTQHAASGGTAEQTAERIEGIEQDIRETDEQLALIDEKQKDLQLLLRPAGKLAKALIDSLGMGENALKDDLGSGAVVLSSQPINI